MSKNRSIWKVERFSRKSNRGRWRRDFNESRYSNYVIKMKRSIRVAGIQSSVATSITLRFDPRSSRWKKKKKKEKKNGGKKKKLT